MLVVFLISIIYFIVGAAFNVHQDQQTGIKQIKKIFADINSSEVLKLVCFGDCSRCLMYEDENLLKDDIDIGLSEDTKVYKLDSFEELKEVEYPLISLDGKDEKVCFEYEYFPNGSGLAYIVFSNNKYYVFESYFGETKEFSDIDKAKEVYLIEAIFPTDESEYYGG